MMQRVKGIALGILSHVRTMMSTKGVLILWLSCNYWSFLAFVTFLLTAVLERSEI